MLNKAIAQRVGVAAAVCVCTLGLVFGLSSIPTALAYTVATVPDIMSVDSGGMAWLKGFSSGNASAVTHSSNITLTNKYATDGNTESYNLAANSAVLTGIPQTQAGWVNTPNTWVNYRWDGAAITSDGRLLDVNMRIDVDKVYCYDAAGDTTSDGKTRVANNLNIFAGASFRSERGWLSGNHENDASVRKTGHYKVTLTFSYHDGSNAAIPDGTFVIDDIDAYQNATVADADADEIWQLVSGFKSGVNLAQDTNVVVETTNASKDTYRCSGAGDQRYGDPEHNSIPQDRVVAYTHGSELKFNVTVPTNAASGLSFGVTNINDSGWFDDVSILKYDSDVQRFFSQGNGNLVGTKFQIINDNGYDIVVQVPSGGDYANGRMKVVPDGEVITTLTINSQGKASTTGKMLPHGRYILHESQAPVGYKTLADSVIYV